MPFVQGQVSCATPMPLRCKKKSKKVSSNDFGEGKRRKPLRCHVIVLLEAMVNAIDINDVDKTSLAFTVGSFAFIHAYIMFLHH